MKGKYKKTGSLIMVMLLVMSVFAGAFAGSAAAQTTTSVTGTITTDDGETVRTQVKIYNASGTEVANGSSNENGSYTISVPGSGTYDVKVKSQQYADETKSVDIASGETRAVNFELSDKSYNQYENKCYSASRAYVSYPSRPCTNTDVQTNDISNTTKLAILQNLESNAQFNDELTTVYENYAEDTSQIAFVEGRAGVASSWESGENETEALTSAENNIEDYYNVKRVNLMNVMNHIILNGGYANGEVGQFNYTASSDNPFAYMSAQSNTVNGNTQTYIVRPKPEHVTRTVTVNGSQRNMTVPVVEIFNYQSEQVVYDGPLYTNTDNIDYVNNELVVQTGAYNNVTINLGLTTTGFEHPDGNESSRSVWDANKWSDRYTAFESQETTVKNNFDSVLVNDTYVALNNGDIDVADLLGMNGLVRELSGESTVTSDRFKMAMYRILNIGSPDLSTTSSISGTYTGFTDTTAVYNDETDTRAVHNSNWTSEQVLNGMMFTQNVSLANGDTVAVEPFTDFEQDDISYIGDVYENYRVELEDNTDFNGMLLYKNGEVVDKTTAVRADDGTTTGNKVEFAPDTQQIVVKDGNNQMQIYTFGNDTLTQQYNNTAGTSGNSLGVTDEYAYSPYGTGGTYFVNLNTFENFTVADPVYGVSDDLVAIDPGIAEIKYVNASSGSLETIGSAGTQSTVYTKTLNYDNVVVAQDSNNVYVYDYDVENNTTSLRWQASSGIDVSQHSIGGKYLSHNTTGGDVLVRNLQTGNVVANVSGVEYANINSYYKNVKGIDSVTGPAEFVDANSSNNEKTLSNGVFKVNNMSDTNGTEIPTVTNETLDYLVNQTGVNNSSVIVDDMDRFNSTDDIDGTDDVEAVCEYYGTSECDAPLNTQSWDGGADYSTTNTTEFAQELQEIYDTIKTLQTYDDGSGDVSVGFGDGIIGQFLSNLGIAGIAGIGLLVYIFFMRD